MLVFVYCATVQRVASTVPVFFNLAVKAPVHGGGSCALPSYQRPPPRLPHGDSDSQGHVHIYVCSVHVTGIRPRSGFASFLNAAGERSTSPASQPGQRSTTVTVVDLFLSVLCRVASVETYTAKEGGERRDVHLTVSFLPQIGFLKAGSGQ